MAARTWWCFAKEEAAQKRLVLAGCDPATGLLSRMVEKISGVEIVSAAASSKLALTWLSEGKVHIAGSHLEDPKTGEFNLPFIRKQFPDEDFSVVTFARWEEGLVVAPGNPKGVRKIEDLARKNVRFVNREPGSGSRALLDKLLEKAGMDAHEGPGIRSDRLRSSGGRLLRGVPRCRRLPGDPLRRADLRPGFHSAAQRALRSGDAQADRRSARGQGIPRCAAARHAAAQAGSAGRLRYVADGDARCLEVGTHARLCARDRPAARADFDWNFPKGFPRPAVPPTIR